MCCFSLLYMLAAVCLTAISAPTGAFLCAYALALWFGSTRIQAGELTGLLSGVQFIIVITITLTLCIADLTTMKLC